MVIITTLVVLLVVYLFFDANYFLQSIFLLVYSSIHKYIRKPVGLLEESVLKGICLTTDLDYMFHMNNARYLRECDFGRLLWLKQTSLLDVLTSLGGNIILSASTIRYRKSLQLFDTFNLRTKLVCWDEKAFYLEQRFERRRDNFICAIVLIKFPSIRVSPQIAAQKLLGDSAVSPAMPDDVKHWVQFNQLSSEKLKVS